jgi:hypothetical protein
MAAVIRLLAALVAMFGTFVFTYWVPFALILPEGWPQWLPLVGAFVCAVLAGGFVWRQSGEGARGRIRPALLGAVIVGALGFIGGFFGPLIFTPEANQGPLLGLFITGPLGVLLGGIGGAVAGRRRPVSGSR